MEKFARKVVRGSLKCSKKELQFLDFFKNDVLCKAYGTNVLNYTELVNNINKFLADKLYDVLGIDLSFDEVYVSIGKDSDNVYPIVEINNKVVFDSFNFESANKNSALNRNYFDIGSIQKLICNILFKNKFAGEVHFYSAYLD